MNKLKLFTICLLAFSTVHAQTIPSISTPNIYGTWKCIKMDDRGMEDYGLDKAMAVKKSLLHIEKSNITYQGVNFIKPCKFVKWEISNFDTSYYHGIILERLYYKKELHNILEFMPVDAKGEAACINNCSEYLLKGDTLINICGGYTYYMLKIDSLQARKVKVISRNSR